jgi:hypothetical protein
VQLTWVIGLLSASLTYGAETGALRVGAAKGDITPPDSILPCEQHGPGMNTPAPSLVGVHDRLYARAIVLDNGPSAAIIISLDLVKAPRPAGFVARSLHAKGHARHSRLASGPGSLQQNAHVIPARTLSARAATIQQESS